MPSRGKLGPLVRKAKAEGWSDWIRNEHDDRAVLNGCTFDIERAEHVRTYFETYLCHSKGVWAGKPFKLLDWEWKELLAPAFGWIRPDGYRRIRKVYCEVAKKNGKMLDLATPIPTPAGWTTMADVRVGDVLFDEQGKQCKVTFLGPVDFSPESYRIAFSNGEQIRACADHLWLTTARVNMPGVRRGRAMAPKGATVMAQVRSTKEIYDTQYYGARNDRNHSLDMPLALKIAERGLPVDPYVLGCWLGDGTSAAAQLTYARADSEIAEHLAAAGVRVRPQNRPAQATTITACLQTWPDGTGRCRRGHGRENRNSKGRCLACEREVSRARRRKLPLPPYQFQTLQQDLRDLNVLENKHIPPIYLRASFEQRLSLLQGLMDTDGYADGYGTTAEFTTTRERLAADVSELLATLGIKFRCSERVATLYGRVISPKWRVQFYALRDVMPVFRLRRKLERMKSSHERRNAPRSRTVQIASVEPCEPVPMRCIAVDSPSHQYRCGRTMLPTHNSTLGSGVGMYGLTADGEAGAEIYCVATKRDQAALIHDEAIRMVKASPVLYPRLRINHVSHVISHGPSNSKYAALSSDGPGTEGLNAHMVLIDEMHAWKDRVLWGSLRYATAARMQPMVWVFTTAGVYDITSIGWQEHEYARRWLEGTDDDRVEDQEFLGYICAADKGADIMDVKAHKAANPSYGITIQPDEIMKAAKDAKEKPTELFTFMRYRLNQWTEALSAWIAPDKWNACGEPVDEAELVGRKCYGGLDIASKVDLCAWVLVFPPIAPDTKWTILPRCWVPRESATVRSTAKGVNYLAWAREGSLILTPGNRTDLIAVCEQIKRDRKKFAIESAGADPWNIGKLQDDLDPSGEWLVEYRQNLENFSHPTKELEAMALSGDIRHGGHPVLKWCVSNVVLLDDTNGNVRPSKKHSIEKIDVAVAAIMAFGRGLAEKDTTSVYEKSDLFVIE